VRNAGTRPTLTSVKDVAVKPLKLMCAKNAAQKAKARLARIARPKWRHSVSEVSLFVNC
jgi:hypothetical protein